MLVSLCSTCIVNGVQFITCDRDFKLKTQNNGVSEPWMRHENFYVQLQDILEFSYLNRFSVVLFNCIQFKCDARRKVIEKNITSIEISTEAYKNDQFILVFQAKHVYYVEDPLRGPNWHVVKDVNHQSVWNIIEDGLSDIDLLQHNSSSNFLLFVDLGNFEQITLQQNDRDIIQVQQLVNIIL